MVVEDETLQSTGASGYPELRDDVSGAVYAIYPGADDGSPFTVRESIVNGSAVAISDDGLFLTSTQVLNEIGNSYVGLDYTLTLGCNPGLDRPIITIPVEEVVGQFPQDEQDVTILRADVEGIDHLSVRTRGDAERPGQPVATFGYPVHEVTGEGWHLLQRTFSGVVSSIAAFDGIYPMYEVDALFNPGVGGGPLVSLRTGEVLGIVHGTKWYSQQLESEVVPYPGLITRAKAITAFEGFPASFEPVGNRLEQLGV